MTMRNPLRLRRLSDESGFSIVEFMIYLMIGAIVVASIYQLMIGQNRLYMKQRALQNVRGSLRAAATLVSWELRQASAANGDIQDIDANSFAVRSVQGGGVICGEHTSQLRYGIWGSSGEFYETSDDSALFYAAGNAGTGDDQWKAVSVVKVWDPAGGGVPTCFWGDSTAGAGKGSGSGMGAAGWSGDRSPDLILEVSGDVENVYIGAAIRTFRRVEYGLYTEDGRWWLGRKVGAAASYEKLAGPLSSPADSGLVFTYYDDAGVVIVMDDDVEDAATLSSVASVEFVLRGESYRAVPQPGQAPSAQQDSLTTRVSLRG